MPDDESLEPPQPAPSEPARPRVKPSPVEGVLLWLFVGFGVAALVGALVVGAYTLFGATRANYCVGDGCAATTHLATSLAWLVVGAAAVVLVGLVVLVRLGGNARLRLTKWVRIVAAVAAVGMVARYNVSHFPLARKQIDTYQLASEQMWTITAAVWLFAIGAAVVALFAFPVLDRPRRLSTVGVVVGVVAAMTLTGVLGVKAVHRGDDSQYVDATTAPAQAVPPLPAVLGRQRFELQLPNRGRVNIYPAGAGFIVKSYSARDSGLPNVVAYSATGQERWHYQRTGPVPPPTEYGRNTFSVQELAYFDAGAVVVLSFFSDRGPYVGLDAVTGAQLWTSIDPAIGSAVASQRPYVRAPHFLGRVDGQLIAFDPRTGRRLWSVEDPMHCPATNDVEQPLPNFDRRHVYSVDTDTRIAAVVDCSTAAKAELRLIVVDPATGDVATDKSLTSLDGVARDDLNSWAAYPVPGTDAVMLALYMKGPSSSSYVGPTGKRIDFIDPESFNAVGDGVFTVRNHDRLRLYSGDAIAQCDVALGTTKYVGYTILREQLVVDDRNASTLDVFDRATCQQVATVPVPAGYQGPLIPVRGATLMTRVDQDNRTSVLGFVP